MIIVAIPTQGNKGLEDRLFEHFGKAPTYTIANLESGHLTVIDNTSDHMGGRLTPPELLKGIGADTIIVHHLGSKAAVQCQELGIRVLSGAEGSVRNVLEQLREGSLKAASLETIGIQNDG
ncbi:MAG: dinitrogenase iron-molybdenum cofactor biosynthesis protein [Methanomassiliicoccus sp.]|nr:dinitrogenase iron-molybdenum cofactor biosynthesis protein [Methanomassiliicoccus sp.]